ncbi:MAG: hypothetical protein WC615_00035 [Mucilaginibacter sp.]|jgi:hypothetical protein|uniref:hypothetical protein n=1 Tax=Mucilaginibacter sp. TaxID=1882438 RepID=UPI00356A8B71
MSKYSLLYLDDEKDRLVLPIKEKLEDQGQLTITVDKPKSFEDEIDKLAAILPDFSGIVLDLQLNGPQEDGSQVRYQAPSLAQQLRILASEGKAKDVPIFLCSTDDKVKASFKRDFTSHDLFDWTFMKDEISSATIDKICSIVEGYDQITKGTKDFSALLQRDYNDLDQRILSRFINEENPPVHEVARIIFKEVIQEPGLLINEEILAARLGIDKEKSKDWDKILDAFKSAGYDGIFESGWNRWWADRVADLFESFAKENLGFLNATERVNALKAKFNLENIVPAKALPLSNSTNFWTICQATGNPIDTFEGYKIDKKKEPRPWQEYSYVSLYALMERIAEAKNIKLHPSEFERFDIESAAL